MATDWAADVKKYAAKADDAVIAGIVRYCGIALSKPDSALVAFSDAKELARVRNNFLKKKLARTEADEVLDAAIAKVGTKMKADKTRNRVTVYYLLAHHFKALDTFAPKAKTVKKTTVDKVAAPAKAKAATAKAAAPATPKTAPAKATTSAKAKTAPASTAAAPAAKKAAAAPAKKAAAAAKTEAPVKKTASRKATTPAKTPARAAASAPKAAPAAKASRPAAAPAPVTAVAAATPQPLTSAPLAPPAPAPSAPAAPTSPIPAAQPSEAPVAPQAEQGGIGAVWWLLGLVIVAFVLYWLFG